MSKRSQHSDSLIGQAVSYLTARGYTIVPPVRPDPVDHCAICGMTGDENSETFGGWLIEVTLQVDVGEEGGSEVTRFYCDEHVDDVRNAVLPLGLGSHRHGSTTLIEADTSVCGGYGTCTHFPEDGYKEVYHDGPLRAGSA